LFLAAKKRGKRQGGGSGLTTKVRGKQKNEKRGREKKREMEVTKKILTPIVKERKRRA